MIACGLMFCQSRAIAQSTFDKELATLSAQRGEAVFKALKPINDQYRSALEAMLKRATQAGELDSAMKIREELKNAPTNEVMTSNFSKSAEATKLESRLVGSSWLWGNPPQSKFTFLANGKFEGHMKFARWSIVADNLIFYQGAGNNGEILSGIMCASKNFDQIFACEWGSSGIMRPIVIPRVDK